ncbi:hypothetical protein CPB97_002537 [Podila verticillata]|nr:hypothetical protein CPB97_002537 [Podila verticillata]
MIPPTCPPDTRTLLPGSLEGLPGPIQLQQYCSTYDFYDQPVSGASIHSNNICNFRETPLSDNNNNNNNNNTNNHSHSHISRKRSFRDLENGPDHRNTISTKETEGEAQCPRLQAQQLSLPRKSLHQVDDANAGPGACLYPNDVKANFVDCLVVTAAVVIESIWPPPPPGSPEYLQKQKGLPLRTFVQETLKRSRSSYSTLQTALFYLYKIRNKVPDVYLRRREEQALLNQQRLAAVQPSGLVTPPASPHHFQHTEFSSPDYFSLHSDRSTPSPSTTSMASASPCSEYSPSASPTSSTASSPASDSGSPCSVSSVSSSSSCSSASSSSSSSSSGHSNRIIYCGRRTFLAALMVASKYLQDRNYSNKAWAKISGLSIKEINANELIFLKLIDYSLFVSNETFMRWTGLLVAHGREATRKFLHSSRTTPVNHHSHNHHNNSNSNGNDAYVHKTPSMASPSLVLNSNSIRFAPKLGPMIMSHLPPSPPSDPEESIENPHTHKAKMAKLSNNRVGIDSFVS